MLTQWRNLICHRPPPAIQAPQRATTRPVIVARAARTRDTGTLTGAGRRLGVVVLADAVTEGETESFDERVLLARASRQSLIRWGRRGWRIWGDVTALGGTVFLTLLTLAVSGYLLLDSKRHAALLVLIAVGGGVLLSATLKRSFDRPRPDLFPHGQYVSTASFPSGHSMVSAATYLTLGALLARVQSRPALKAYVLILAALLMFAVGASRVYLGVHWPTDVLAGWTAGATWALLCWLVARWLQRRGQVEGYATETGGLGMGCGLRVIGSGWSD